jgi:hypothetical protein
MPAREWESTFDVWVQGDVQEFVGKVIQAMQKQDEVKRAKEDRAGSRMAGEKRKREVEEQEEGRTLNSAMAASSISNKRRRLAPVIGRNENDSHVDVFGPVVLPGIPTIGAGVPEIHASVSCGMQRQAIGYRTYPLGSITRDSPRLTSGTMAVIGEHGHESEVVRYSDASVAIERYN